MVSIDLLGRHHDVFLGSSVLEYLPEETEFLKMWQKVYKQ